MIRSSPFSTNLHHFSFQLILSSPPVEKHVMQGVEGSRTRALFTTHVQVIALCSPLRKRWNALQISGSFAASIYKSPPFSSHSTEYSCRSATKCLLFHDLSPPSVAQLLGLSKKCGMIWPRWRGPSSRRLHASSGEMNTAQR